MKYYIIAINNGWTEEHITINGDSLRPFSIANNLWNYITPWTAERRLKKLAQAWEKNGFSVTYRYGTILDMPTMGNEFNISVTLKKFN